MDLLSFIQSVTLETAGFGGLALAIVYVLKATGMVKTGDMARLATVIVSALLSEASPEQSLAMAPVMIAIASGGHELIELIAKKVKDMKGGKEEPKA